MAKLPQEVAQKTQSLGLYLIEGILTVAMATPEDEVLVRRLSQIAQLPISPVFASGREITDAIGIHYSNDKDIEESLAALERLDLFNKPDYSQEQLTALDVPNARAPVVRGGDQPAAADLGDDGPRMLIVAGAQFAHPLPGRRDAAGDADLFAQAAPGADLPFEGSV